MHADIRLHLEPVPGEEVAHVQPGRGAISLALKNMITPWPSHVCIWIEGHQYDVTAVERIEGGIAVPGQRISDVADMPDLRADSRRGTTTKPVLTVSYQLVSQEVGESLADLGWRGYPSGDGWPVMALVVSAARETLEYRSEDFLAGGDCEQVFALVAGNACPSTSTG